MQKLKIKPPPGGVGPLSASALGCRGQRIVVALQARGGLILWQSLVIDQTGEILIISILHQRTRQVPQLRSGIESHSVSNFFRAGDLHALTLFDRLDAIRGFAATLPVSCGSSAGFDSQAVWI